MAEPSAQEILMIALMNRARLDPAGEAARFGIDLNEGLSAGTLSATSKQVLAFDAALFDAANKYSQAMIDQGFFGHAENGTTPQDRAEDSGYVGGVGENIGYVSGSLSANLTSAIKTLHELFFVDDGITGRGHRLNILNDSYQSVGVGQSFGDFAVTASKASTVTIDFGLTSPPKQFVTGLSYTDSDGDAFYSVGEGRGSVAVQIGAGVPTATGTAGAYTLAATSGIQQVKFSGGGLAAPVTVDIVVANGKNALVNLVDTSTVETSVSLTAVSGVTKIIGLGTTGLSLSGLSSNDTVLGTVGNDTLNGGAGSDMMAGRLGDDTYFVDSTGDAVFETAGQGNDLVIASLSHTLRPNVERLIFTGTGGFTGVGNDLANILIGNAGNNILDGGTGADAMRGGAGNDRYTFDDAGDTASEELNEGLDTVVASVAHTLRPNFENLTITGPATNAFGSTVANILTGNALGNVINGKEGNDVLVGGGGSDTFMFDTALSAATNVDRITDFNPVDDVFRLGSAIFTGIPGGVLAAGSFHVGTAAADAADRIIYDQATGRIFYDADGLGGAAQVLFAVLDTKPANLTNADFVVI